MPRYCKILAIAGLALVPAMAGAQDQNQGHKDTGKTLSEFIELPAHQLLVKTITETEGPNAFTTDGCSGGMSASWSGISDLFPALKVRHGEVLPWRHCCVTHDRAYHTAGGAQTAQASYDARLAADEALRACVIANGETRKTIVAEEYNVSPESVAIAYATLAETMFQSVRLGGGPCTGLPWRWGYGFPNCF